MYLYNNFKKSFLYLVCKKGTQQVNKVKGE